MDQLYCEDVSYIQDQEFKARLKAWGKAGVLMPCADDRSEEQCESRVLKELGEVIEKMQAQLK